MGEILSKGTEMKRTASIVATAMVIALLALACSKPAATKTTTKPLPTTTSTTQATTSKPATTATQAPLTTTTPGKPTATTAPGSATPKQYAAAPKMTIDKSKKYTATIHTSKGDIFADLLASEAPITVNSFVFLSRDGYFNNVIFHRIIKDFMIQTGDPTGTGAGGPGYSFQNEPVTRKYVAGTLAMANAGQNTNGSQFFIVHKDYPLPPDYTIFGIVTRGMDVVDALAKTPVRASSRGEMSVPTQVVQITSIDIQEQ